MQKIPPFLCFDHQAEEADHKKAQGGMQAMAQMKKIDIAELKHAAEE